MPVARLIVIVVLLAASIFILTQMLSFVMGTRSFRRQYKRDLRRLRQEIADIKEALIPFEMDEFRIISAHPIVKGKKRGVAKLQNGFLSTIFQEPVLAFAIKDRMVNGQLIMVVESKEDEYTFNYNADQIDVEFNGKALGIIDKEDRLLGPEGTELGKLEISDSRQYQKVILGDMEVAHLNSFEPASATESDRLFSLFHEFKASDEEEFVALSIYGLIIKPRLSIDRA